MAKRRNSHPPQLEPGYPEAPAPSPPLQLDPYEDDDVITLPWLPLHEREPGWH
jgi:hypothetical protein